MSRARLLIIAVVLAVSLIAPGASRAQTDRLCFDVPGITNCVEGRFRQFWEQNGALQVFGYPISAATDEQTAEGTFLVQYFERNRFELHPEKAAPYDVLLGRLGDVRLKQQGRDWFTFAKGQQQANCLWAPETGHSICDQENGAGFKTYYETHGLQDAALDARQRSLALFGLPLSEPMMETNAAGDTVLTQWFERARFEWHPQNQGEFRVLLGLLGNETTAGGSGNGGTPDVNACAGIASPVDAVIEPNCVKFGETFTIQVYGFSPRQKIGYWITDSNGVTVGTAQSVTTDTNGSFNGYVSTSGFFDYVLNPGDYVFVAQDIDATLRPSTAPFRVIR